MSAYRVWRNSRPRPKPSLACAWSMKVRAGMDAAKIKRPPGLGIHSVLIRSDMLRKCFTQCVYVSFGRAAAYGPRESPAERFHNPKFSASMARQTPGTTFWGGPGKFSLNNGRTALLPPLHCLFKRDRGQKGPGPAVEPKP